MTSQFIFEGRQKEEGWGKAEDFDTETNRAAERREQPELGMLTGRELGLLTGRGSGCGKDGMLTSLEERLGKRSGGGGEGRLRDLGYGMTEDRGGAI